MFDWLEKRKKAKEDELKQKAKEMAHQIIEEEKQKKLDEEEKERKEKEEELRLAKIALDDKRKKAKESNEIYLEIIAEEITSDGIKFEMDWNQAFIDACKKAGITGEDDEIIVHKYLGLISKRVQLDEIAQNYVNNDGYEEGQISNIANEPNDQSQEE